jgi:hypothetical protein
MRSLAERLSADGHDVTYLTRRQWEPGEEPTIPGVRVIAVSRQDDLYGPGGRRRIGPPLRFGAGVLRHFARHRDRNCRGSCDELTPGGCHLGLLHFLPASGLVNKARTKLPEYRLLTPARPRWRPWRRRRGHGSPVALVRSIVKISCH